MATVCSWPEWTCCVWTLAMGLCWSVAARDLLLWGSNHLGAFTFLCLQELRTQRWGNASNSCGLELQGELCTHECLNTRRKLNASGVGYWKNLMYFGIVLYSRGDWRVSFMWDIQENGFRLNSAEPLGISLAILPVKPLFWWGVLKRNHQLQPWCFAE